MFDLTTIQLMNEAAREAVGRGLPERRAVYRDAVSDVSSVMSELASLSMMTYEKTLDQLTNKPKGPVIG